SLFDPACIGDLAFAVATLPVQIEQGVEVEIGAVDLDVEDEEQVAVISVIPAPAVNQVAGDVGPLRQGRGVGFRHGHDRFSVCRSSPACFVPWTTRPPSVDTRPRIETAAV